jgi:hypothetical protein
MSTKVKGTIRHWLHKGEPHFEDVIEQMGFAMLKGYSVVFIKQLFGMSRARYLYEVLRAEGFIDPLPQKKYKLDPIPLDLKDALKKVDLRFPRWCYARKPSMDPVITSKMLGAPMVLGDAESEAAHRAFYGDFPNIYRKIYKVELNEIRPYKEHLGPTPRPSYLVKPKNQVYVAETVELGPKVFGSGLTAALALKKLQHELGIRRGIDKLKLLQDRYPM